ncbi:alpha/beta hydrolase [Leifsonia sp. ZF2019]|uniref:esterase/lipase family protein n=1 Tax=Leifsonia sp. ZF2019 TaxID=2781978 RepID=UPI001CBF3766|nr:alpha/beta hydrolase [Leifsonia sp. ZF2019]UAJ79874.1 alpha/beta hydrolase [Leifsonia sp. ZF2019]
MGIATAARKAGVVLVDYAYAAGEQLRGMLDRRRLRRALAPAGGPDRLPVLLLPGVYETWRFLRPLARHLAGRGHDVHVVDGLRWNIASVEDGAREVARFLVASGIPRVAIVAHSKGGLIAKRVLELESERIAVVLAIATPFAGSPLARLVPLAGVRALGPAGADIVGLAARPAANDRIVSIAPWFDPHIPGGSELAGARSVRLRTGGHFRILSSRELFLVVDEELARTSRRPPAAT